MAYLTKNRCASTRCVYDPFRQIYLLHAGAEVLYGYTPVLPVNSIPIHGKKLAPFDPTQTCHARVSHLHILRYGLSQHRVKDFPIQMIPVSKPLALRFLSVDIISLHFSIAQVA